MVRGSHSHKVIIFTLLCVVLVLGTITKSPNTALCTYKGDYSPVACTFYTPGNEYEQCFENLQTRWARYSHIPLVGYKDTSSLLPTFKGYKLNNLKHHWSGNSKKIDYVISAMDDHPERTHIVFMDCDAVPLKTGIDDILQKYACYDLVCAYENQGVTIANIGFMIFQNTDKIKRFFTLVSKRVRMFSTHDQREVQTLSRVESIDLRLFRPNHVSVFPTLRTRFIKDNPYIIKPIRGFNKKLTKLEITKRALEGHFIEKLIT